MEVTISLSLHCRLDFKTEAEPGYIVSGRLINSAKQFFTKQEKKYLDNEMLEWLMMEKKTRRMIIAAKLLTMVRGAGICLKISNNKWK